MLHGTVECFSRAGRNPRLEHFRHGPHCFVVVDGPFYFDQLLHNFGQRFGREVEQIIGIAAWGGIAMMGVGLDAGGQTGEGISGPRWIGGGSGRGGLRDVFRFGGFLNGSGNRGRIRGLTLERFEPLEQGFDYGHGAMEPVGGPDAVDLPAEAFEHGLPEPIAVAGGR